MKLAGVSRQATVPGAVAGQVVGITAGMLGGTFCVSAVGMHRLSLLLCFTAVVLVSHRAHAGRSHAARAPEIEATGRYDHLFLSKGDIDRVVSADMPELKSCWQKHVNSRRKVRGHARLELDVRPDGTVKRKKLIAPGASSRRLRRCVYRVVSQWRFPMRDRHTSTIIPFHFLRTHVRGAGPMRGCRAVRGCKSRRGN